MSTSKPPNIDFGSPVIFFDSDPEEQRSLLHSYWSSLQSSLRIAWTGEVPAFHAPGTLRIVFWTSDGKQGIKDYELHEYDVVRKAWESLYDMPDVKRAVVMGYSGQNPYIMNYPGGNPWADTYEVEKRQKRKIERIGPEEQTSRKLLDIDSVIMEADKLETDDETRKHHQSDLGKTILDEV